MPGRLVAGTRIISIVAARRAISMVRQLSSRSPVLISSNFEGKCTGTQSVTNFPAMGSNLPAVLRARKSVVKARNNIEIDATAKLSPMR